MNQSYLSQNQQQGAKQLNQQDSKKNKKQATQIVEEGSQKQLDVPQNIKISLVGNPQVGKSLILKSYMQLNSESGCVKNVNNNQLLASVDGFTINLKLCENEKNDQISSSFEDTDIFLFIFSVVLEESRNSIIYKWLPNLRNDKFEKIPKLVIGNKTDLRDRIKNKIEKESIFEKEGLKYFECSALKKQNLREIFDEAIKIVLQYRFKQQNKNTLTSTVQSQIIITKNNNIKIKEIPNQQLNVCEHQQHLEDIISQKNFAEKSLICKICNAQLSWSFFTKSSDRKSFLFQSIINFQLQELQKKYALYIKACKNKECDFFFILSPSCSMEVPLIIFCPICIQTQKLQ